MYNLFEAEAVSALEHGMVLPAHDYILASHTFNILHAGGVTERRLLPARDLSPRTKHIEQRQRL